MIAGDDNPAGRWLVVPDGMSLFDAYGHGLAAVGIGAGMSGYHSPADTADRVDPATLVAVCRLVVATVVLTATTSAPEQPAVLPAAV